jgi:predicted phosphodiesterase
MNVAVISDIHANLPALEAVLAEIDEAAPDQIWCLGDAVGYGARPSECLEILNRRCDVFLVGNHDLAATGAIDISAFSPGAAQSALWTRKNLSKADLELLAGLQGTSAKREGFGLYHASPRDPIWEYVVDTDLAEENLRSQEERIALIGHSHLALYFSQADEMSRTSAVQAGHGTSVEMTTGKWLLNPGSVGQPRDGDPRAAWLSLETEAPAAEWHRVEYPIEQAAEQIRQAGLPGHLADRLSQGH